MEATLADDDPQLKTVWHYTDSAGLAGIVRSHSIWATSAAFMNDPAELDTGFDLADAVLQERYGPKEKDASDLLSRILRGLIPIGSRALAFITCASEDENNLTMWRGYTGDKVGYAIELVSTLPLSPVRQRVDANEALQASGFFDPENRSQRLEAVRDVGRVQGVWKPVAYEPPKQKAKIEAAAAGLFKEIDSGTIRGTTEWFDNAAALVDATRHIKHQDYAHEQEWRIVCEIAEFAIFQYVLHRPGRYGVTPYVELGLPHPADDPESNDRQRLRRLPINRVIVGPAPDQEAAALGAELLLRAHGYESVEVMRSETPFRR